MTRIHAFDWRKTEMKKRILIALCVFVVLASVGLLVFRLWESGVFIFERTADVSLNRVIWNGKEYSPVSGEYTEGRTIAKGEGDWVVNAVKEDSAHTFIVARSFLDQQGIAPSSLQDQPAYSWTWARPSNILRRP